MKTDLQNRIESLYELSREELLETSGARETFEIFLGMLNSGDIRSAHPAEEGWQVNEWVKKGVLVGFRLGEIVEMGSAFPFFDKSTFPLKPMKLTDGVRVVPGGTSVRSGSFVAPGVILMPPCYVNVGAYVDEGTLLDSHALVGSCAQIGKKCHISAGAQIGGVLEPVNASPVIIEDGVLVGGNCGIYEGILVKKNAILASGTIITGSTAIYDLVNETVISPSGEGPLTVPENAVVVPGSRPASGDFAASRGVSLYTPVIVKYRDAKSDAKSALEEGLREASPRP